MKHCLHCNTELIPPKTTNNYLKSNFRLKKFCTEQCRIEFNNNLKKKNYVLKDTEHDNKLNELNKLIKGEICHVKGKKDSYNPDITKADADYELEVFRNMHHLKNKVGKWNNARKHILIVTLSDQTKELFDEVYFFNDNSLIREK
ncbi:hypothetical protein HZA33_01745 [Candidatus Pacearchaeota archaeon]|nr:hypothetical protein [Candidatus Pacearchaeota archaeon]